MQTKQAINSGNPHILQPRKALNKNLVTDFLRKTWYDPNHYINTKGRTDPVIHNGNKAKIDRLVFVIPEQIEVKMENDLIYSYHTLK